MQGDLSRLVSLPAVLSFLLGFSGCGESPTHFHHARSTTSRTSGTPTVRIQPLRSLTNTNALDLRDVVLINPDGTFSDPAGAERPGREPPVRGAEESMISSTDRELRDDINGFLKNESAGRLGEVRVLVVNQSVILRGTVGTPAEKAQIAQRVSGVIGQRHLENELKILPSSNPRP